MFYSERYNRLSREHKKRFSRVSAWLWVVILAVEAIFLFLQWDSVLPTFQKIWDEISVFFVSLHFENMAWLLLILFGAMFFSPISPRLSLLVTLECCGVLVFLIYPIYYRMASIYIGTGEVMKLLPAILLLQFGLALLFTNGLAGFFGTKFKVYETEKFRDFSIISIQALRVAFANAVYRSNISLVLILILSLVDSNWGGIVVLAAVAICCWGEYRNHENRAHASDAPARM